MNYAEGYASYANGRDAHQDFLEVRGQLLRIDSPAKDKLLDTDILEKCDTFSKSVDIPFNALPLVMEFPDPNKYLGNWDIGRICTDLGIHALIDFHKLHTLRTYGYFGGGAYMTYAWEDPSLKGKSWMDLYKDGLVSTKPGEIKVVSPVGILSAMYFVKMYPDILNRQTVDISYACICSGKFKPEETDTYLIPFLYKNHMGNVVLGASRPDASDPNSGTLLQASKLQLLA